MKDEMKSKFPIWKVEVLAVDSGWCGTGASGLGRITEPGHKA